MIHVYARLDNPVGEHDYHQLGCYNKQITKNKTLELEHSFYLGILFALDFQFHPRADHGGLRIHLGLLGYNVDFQICDNRHWDGDMNDWH